jgi:hypothetical protein
MIKNDLEGIIEAIIISLICLGKCLENERERSQLNLMISVFCILYLGEPSVFMSYET